MTFVTYLFAVSGSSLYIYRLYLLTYLVALTPHRHADAARNRAVMSTLALALCGRATRPFGTGQRALLATLSTNLRPASGSELERRQDSPMQAAQSVLLIVADDMQPSDIHALRHLHAPPILAETPWQALEHVPILEFRTSRLRQSAAYTSAVTRRVVQVAAGCRWAAKPEACNQLANKTAFFRCCCSGPSRPVLDNHTLATCPHAPQFHADAEGLPTPSLDRLVKE